MNIDNQILLLLIILTAGAIIVLMVVALRRQAMVEIGEEKRKIHLLVVDSDANARDDRGYQLG